MLRYFTYNGTASTPYFTVTSIKRALLPAVGYASASVPGRYGAIFQRNNVGARQITITAEINADTFAEFNDKKRAISEWLYVDEPEALVVSDEPDLTYYAIINGGTDVDELGTYGRVTLSFVALDPFAYAPEVTRVVGGTGDFFLSPVQLAGTTGVIVHERKIEAQPIFTTTFTASATSFRVTHAESGQFVEVDRAFVAADVLVIDCAEQTVTLNGAAVIQNVTFESDYFRLQSGANTIDVSPINVADVTARYRPRYL